MDLNEILANEEKSFIIAEIGQNHDGSLGMAHSYIEACSNIGVNAIKFQTHIAEEESSLDDEFRINFSYQDRNRFEYWKRMEFTKAQWIQLKKHADDKGIKFFSTPFSVAAVELLSEIGIEGWKIGSGDTLSNEIIDLIIETKKPTIVSTGMSKWDEINSLVNLFKSKNVNFSLMQCTSKYPTKLDQVGLNILDKMKSKYKCRVGLSDHSGSTSPSLAAISRGFNLIEIHATFDTRMFGPDVNASLTLEEIKSIIDFSKDLEFMNSNPVDKDSIAIELKKQKLLFGRSLTLKNNLSKGHIITRDDLTLKKPGTGIPIENLPDILGKRLRTDVKKNRILKRGEIE
mgnify:CR=1 FL=1